MAYKNVKANEYCKIPQWLADTIKGKETVTYIIGPWVFINGFENTPDGKYLIKIFPYYFNMSPRTKEKVDNILKTYEWWARTHKEYVEGITNAMVHGVNNRCNNSGCISSDNTDVGRYETSD